MRPALDANGTQSILGAYTIADVHWCVPEKYTDM
jgi:hypothetical protein